MWGGVAFGVLAAGEGMGLLAAAAHERLWGVEEMVRFVGEFCVVGMVLFVGWRIWCPIA